MVAASFAFAVLFRAARRDYPVVMLAAIGGYVVSRFGGHAFGAPAGVFLSALVVTAAGNAYARWMQRPGALVRVPGIIMLVPGSLALRGVLTLMQQQDLGAGQDAAMAALNTLMAVIAGLIFGNLVVSARRSLGSSVSIHAAPFAIAASVSGRVSPLSIRPESASPLEPARNAWWAPGSGA